MSMRQRIGPGMTPPVGALLVLLVVDSRTSGFSFPRPLAFPGLCIKPIVQRRPLVCEVLPSTQHVTTRSPHFVTEACASRSDEVITDKDGDLVKSSIIVGCVTAAMGFVYGKVLSASVKGLWTTFPTALLQHKASLNPTVFITGLCSAGGLIMGLLSSKFKSTFTVADFVSAFSSARDAEENAKDLPRLRLSLLPLLFLSLVTSTFGFSVGPEAPMVCAGALVGASLARRLHKKASPKAAETLAYAGAAGALTAFMGIPIAGSIFALELTRSSAGMATGALSPSVAASVAALVLIRGLLLPSNAVGGHFCYGTVGLLGGRTMMLAALASGVGGALVGTIFQKSVAALKQMFWGSNEKTGKSWKKEVFVKTFVGILVGLISSYYPQTMFWGEGSLQCMIDGQTTAFSATKHGLPAALAANARVNPSMPFSGPGGAAQVGAAKLLAIMLACAGKFPGGIIFPLFYAAAPLAHAGCSFVAARPPVVPVVVMCLMASTQASVTRTPLATTLILTLSASGSTELSIILPAVLVSSYLGVWCSQLLSSKSYFQYSTM